MRAGHALIGFAFSLSVVSGAQPPEVPIRLNAVVLEFFERDACDRTLRALREAGAHASGDETDVTRCWAVPQNVVPPEPQ